MHVLKPIRQAGIAFLALSLAIAAVLAFAFRHDDGRPAGGGDFNIRYSEVRCLFDGMDPYKVFTGEIVSNRYGPYNRWTRENPYRPVNGYVPWTYTYMMPFAVLPKLAAAWTWISLEGVALLFLFRQFRRLASGIGRTPLQRAFVETAPFVLLFPFGSALAWGNFGLFFAVAVFLLADALERNRDVWAGVLWAFLMAKPQIGLLFAVPLALQFRWKTFLAAGATLLFASIPPAILCHGNPVRMALDILTTKTRGGFNMDLLPHSVAATASRGSALHVFMLAGLLLCIVLCLLLSRNRNWRIFLLPPIVLSTFWSYGWPHDQCIYALPVLVLAAAAVSEKRRAVRRTLLACLVLFGSSVLLVGVTAQPNLFGFAARALRSILPVGRTGWLDWLFDSGRDRWAAPIFAAVRLIGFVWFCLYLAKHRASTSRFLSRTPSPC